MPPHPWDSPGKDTGGVAISFSSAWTWKVKVKSLSHVRLFPTAWTAAHQAPPSMGFSRQEYWSGVPLPSPYSWAWHKNSVIQPLVSSIFSLLPLPASLSPNIYSTGATSNSLETTFVLFPFFTLKTCMFLRWGHLCCILTRFLPHSLWFLQGESREPVY